MSETRVVGRPASGLTKVEREREHRKRQIERGLVKFQTYIPAEYKDEWMELARELREEKNAQMELQ